MDFSGPDNGTGEGQNPAGQDDSSAPSRAGIEAGLARILASRPFAAAPRQQALLRHIVNETLEDRGDRLKEYAIAVDVFGRASSFDPRTDSIVRVQASRLRSQLTDYYKHEGADDPIRIEVPSGGYQAAFTRAPKAPPETAANETPAPSPAPEAKPLARSWLQGIVHKVTNAHWLLPALAGAGTLAIALLLYGMFFDRPKRDAAVTLPSGPTIFVARYELIDGPTFAEVLRNGLQYELIDSLSRFPELSVLGIDTVYGASGAPGANRHGADFILRGTVQASANDVRVLSQLLDTSNNTIAWSRTDTVKLTDASGILDVQSEIAGAVAGQLGQPYGVIQERLKEDVSESRAVSLDDYLCVLDAYEYSRAKTAEKHAEVRDCLEQVTRHSPNYSPAWAKLSWIYGDEQRNAFNRRPNDVDPFIRARAAAERAVAANPNSAMAHQYLAIAQFNLHDDQAFRKSIETALQLNPNNSEILADAAQMLALVDPSDRARELAEKAIATNPGHPPWYYHPLVVYHVMHGDKAEALAAARKGASDGSPMAGYMLAAALRLNGNDIMADQALEALYATYPDIRGRQDEILNSQRVPPKILKLIFGADP